LKSQNTLLNSNSSLIKQYQEAFKKHGDSPAAVLWPRGRQNIRFDALTAHIKNDGFTILDYGCGLGHLKDYLDQRFNAYNYFGVDLVPEFIHSLTLKHPDAAAKQISSHEEFSELVDHVVVSGTFNIYQVEDQAAYLKYIKDVLIYLFKLCQVSLAVNFMTNKVDFKQAQALHVNPQDMYQFFREQLSPRLTLNQSYMPYEFTLVVFKDQMILRPDNIYGVLP
jgi:cyclopropane fatty-acyl-phospholipid synthase-like methyltransferase